MRAADSALHAVVRALNKKIGEWNKVPTLPGTTLEMIQIIRVRSSDEKRQIVRDAVSKMWSDHGIEPSVRATNAMIELAVLGVESGLRPEDLRNEKISS